MREFSSICILLTRKAVILLYILGKPTFKNAKVFSNSNFFAKKRKKKVACNCKREIGSYYSGWVLKLNRHVRSSTDFLLLFYLEMVSLKKSFETILIEKLGWLRSSKELVEGFLQKTQYAHKLYLHYSLLFKSKRYLLDEMFQQNASKGPISISGDKTRMEHPLFFTECYQFFFQISISKDFYLNFGYFV